MIKKIFSFITIFSLVFVSSLGFNTKALYSASLTSLSATLSREKASTPANYTIKFTTPTGVAASQTIILTFDNSTNLGSVAFGDIDLKDDTVDLPLAATPSGATWGVAVNSGNSTITFTNGSTVVAGGSVIEILIGTHASGGTNQITNGTGATTLLTITGTFGDSGVIGIPILADDTVAITAHVQPTITFTISDNDIYFGNLRSAGACFAQGSDPGQVTCPTQTETEAFNMTAGTNATSGYIITVFGPTLTSGVNTIPAIGGTNTASAPGTEQFGVRYVQSGGIGSVTAPYAAAGFAYNGMASPSQIASATGPSATTTYSARYIANIAALTKAGTYTTAHTYVATATF